MPHYRLAVTLYSIQSKSAEEAVDAHLRVWVKKFIRIPINTAGHTFDLIAGDVKGRLLEFHKRVKQKLENRRKERQDETAGAVGTGDHGITGEVEAEQDQG